MIQTSAPIMVTFALSAFAFVASSSASACSPSEVQDGTCTVASSVQESNSLLQTKVRVGIEDSQEVLSKEVIVEETMLDDDPDEVDGASLVQGKVILWPETASDTLCAMDSVDSMMQIKYSMYSVFEKGATFNLDTCKRDGCVPVFPMHRDATPTQETCQEYAFKRSHPHYAIGTENGKARCYTFADCEANGRVAAPGYTLYTRPAPSTSSPPLQGSTASNDDSTSLVPTAITCAGEAVIKTEIEAQISTSPHPTEETSDDPRQVQPKATILRAAFHDAHDYNGLKAVNRETNQWEEVHGHYGGMNGCVYENPNAEVNAKSELDKMIQGNTGGSAFYNFNLRRWAQNQDPVRIDKLTFDFVQSACENLCCGGSNGLSDGEKATLCGTESNSCEQKYYIDKCYVDVMTFGTLLIIEEVGGPHIPMTWGRKQGDCRNPFANIEVPNHIDTRRIAQGGASLSSFNHSADIFTEFEAIGMNKSEAVALMGAHSYGKIHKYTGGPRTRNRGGGFCADPTKSEGFSHDGQPITKLTSQAAHLDAFSTPAGTCTPSSKTTEGAESCWTNERGFLEPARSDSAKQEGDYSKFLRKSNKDATRAIQLIKPTWGQGGFWDTTPDRLDNQYFVDLDGTDAAERLNCCGPSTTSGCGTDSTEGPMQDKSGQTIDGCNPTVNWCMRSAGDATGELGGGNPTASSSFQDYAMLSTKKYLQSEHNGVHHLYRLAADWALIDDPDAKKVVNTFANDNARFQEAFGAAWAKVIALGYSEGELRTCEA